MLIRRVLIFVGVAAVALSLMLALEMRSASGSDDGAVVSAGKLDPARWSERTLTIANLGHSALLMDWFGTRVISDPTLFNQVGLSLDSLLTIGPRRRVAPPLTSAQLQNVDVILITHAHMDHLDLPSLRALPKRAVVVACSGCASLIRPLGFLDVRELEWGE